MNKSTQISSLRQFWEKCWSQDSFSPSWANRDCPQEIQKIYSNYKVTHDVKILEVGCGQGEIANWFAMNGFFVDAFDISSSAIDKASKKYNNSKINFFVHDLCVTPLLEKYSVIVDRGCFHQIPENLKKEFSNNLCKTAADKCDFYLFIKAFRGNLKLSIKQETNYHTEIIKEHFSDQFTLFDRKLTSLGNYKTKNMLGLFFHLKKI